MNSKMITKSQLSRSEPKKINRNRFTEIEMTWRVIRGENWGKVQGIRGINGRYKIDRGRLRIV